MKEQFKTKAIGAVKITDAVTGELIFEGSNAVHPQNMSRIIARALANEPNSYIYKMCFGNGGTFFNSSQQIVYRQPNTIGSVGLYNQTYEVIVDDREASTPETNSVISAASTAPAITSVAIITAQLDATIPIGQAPSDNATTNPESTYFFDEIGLKSSDGLLLTHIIFSPYEKTANRSFLITYTITISVS